MAPPFVMTTEQWVTDPVEEFNPPGDRSATALPTSPAATAGVPTPWSPTPARMTRQLEPGRRTHRTRVSCGPALGGRPDDLALRRQGAAQAGASAGRAAPYRPGLLTAPVTAMTVAAAPTSSCPDGRSASPRAAFRQAPKTAQRRRRDESDLVFGKASERQLGLPASAADAGAEADGMPRTDVVSRAGINVWLQLYQADRRHLVKVSAEAIRCGIEERRVRLAESQGALVAEVLRRVFDDPRFGLDTAQRELGRWLAASHIRLLGSSAVEPA